MTTKRLYITYPAGETPPETLDVKTQRELPLCGRPVQFRVIGSSHFISSAALGFAELVSCEPPDEEPAAEIPLTRGFRDRVNTRTGGCSVQTTVRCCSLDAFPRDARFTVKHRFAEDAYTTITVEEAADGYTTYHTYPEYDIAVYTHTRLDPATAPPQQTNEPEDTARNTAPTD